MRARYPAALIALTAFAICGAAFGQTPPPLELSPPPAASSAPPLAPPPTVLLPPTSSEPASDLPAAPVAPVKRPRRTAAIIQALDKTTAETLRFEAVIGQPVRYKDLVFIVHACEDSAPELGQRGAAAHLEIESAPRPIPGRATPPTRQLFKGWMFANSPGLHPFEHPVYDAWLLGCRGVAQPGPADAAKPAPAAPALPPAPKAPAAPPAVQPNPQTGSQSAR